MSNIENIAVIGAGLMGHGIAQIFAINGFSVSLMDIRDDLLPMAIKNIRSNLTRMVDNGMGRQEDPIQERLEETKLAVRSCAVGHDGGLPSSARTGARCAFARPRRIRRRSYRRMGRPSDSQHRRV